MVAGARRGDFKPKPLAELVSLLPIKELLLSDDDSHLWVMLDRSGLLKAAVPILREASGDCPACMLAAIRQAGIPVPMADGFNFSAEMKEIWAGINQSNYNEQWEAA